MGDYIDQTVLRLVRNYNENEIISYLVKKIKEIEFEKGLLKSERDEAIYKLQKMLTIDQELKNRFFQQLFFVELNNDRKKHLAEVKRLKRDNLKLIEKLVHKTS